MSDFTPTPTSTDLTSALNTLLSRVVGMAGKYFDGVVPALPSAGSGPVADDPEYTGANELRAATARLPDLLRTAIDNFDFAYAQSDIRQVVVLANKYMDVTRPFSLAKDPAARPHLAVVMHALAQTMRTLAGVVSLFMPDSGRKMLEQLGLGDAPPQSLEDACRWSDALAGTTVCTGVVN